jgi:hypothetical protein
VVPYPGSDSTWMPPMMPSKSGRRAKSLIMCRSSTATLEMVRLFLLKLTGY